MTEHWRLDPTGIVDETDPQAVLRAVRPLLDRRFSGFKHDVLWQATVDFLHIANGEGDAFEALDTPYHDLRHSLACMLAMARLLDAHARHHLGMLSSGDALLGMLCALFHDAGYLRRKGEAVPCGAALMPTHVTRGGNMLADYLQQLRMGGDGDSARLILHYTGYELPVDEIRQPEGRNHALGSLLGTADILGQSADPLYLERCATLLWEEFCACGVGGNPADGGAAQRYATAEDLLRDTPDYHRRLREERLEDLHDGAWQLLDATMGRPNHYRRSIDAHLKRVRELIARGELDRLSAMRPPTVLPPLPTLPRRPRYG